LANIEELYGNSLPIQCGMITHSRWNKCRTLYRRFLAGSYWILDKVWIKNQPCRYKNRKISVM